MAFKTFTSGAVLTAAEINTYLMQQANIVCTAATRPSAPVEGMKIYETDTDREYVYSGSAWAQVSGPPAWTTASLENSWVDFGGAYQATRYAKIGNFVTIQGHVKNGNLLAAAFTLPVGFRPAATLAFAAIDGAAAGADGRTDVVATGAVAPMVGNTLFFSLNITFAVA